LEAILLRYAFLSDVHGHTNILRYVLDLLQADAIDQFVSLGDVGNDDCYDLLRARGAIGVFGNYEVSGYSSLSPENAAFVRHLPPVLTQDDFLAAHAVPTYPAGLLNVAHFADYMRQRDVSWRGMFRYPNSEDDTLFEIFAELQAEGKRLFFHGHTHRQQVWRIRPGDAPREIRGARIARERLACDIIGVGSLGRPEDGPSPRYVIYDSGQNEIELRAVTRFRS
jgi:predicted phosphodiesterase